MTLTVRPTEEFSDWLESLADTRAQAKIAIRIARVQAGLLGDIKSIGDKVSELRVNYGPGYRVYLTRKGDELVILLCGGDKKSQKRDIKRAKEMAAEIHG